jgi:hypothetical protein
MKESSSGCRTKCSRNPTGTKIKRRRKIIKILGFDD